MVAVSGFSHGYMETVSMNDQHETINIHIVANSDSEELPGTQLKKINTGIS